MHTKLPDLKIRKPDATEIIHRVYSPAPGSYAMAFGLMVPFILNAPDASDQPAFTSIWEHAAAILDPGQLLDEGWPKPRGEWLAAGSCHVPAGTTAQPVSVRITVGSSEKQLAVFGPRRASPFGGISAPEPFSRMPISFANAYGGPGHPCNTAGKGLPGADGSVELPNIELPGHLMLTPSDRPPVAGFGPIPADWPQRTRHLGKLDEHWRETRWPHLPEDTEGSYFMAAPEDQWLDGFWQGGEAITVLNMHSEHPRLEGRVPHYRPRFFVHQSTADETDARFAELRVHIDTIWLLPEARLGVAIYRACLPVSDPDGRDVNALVAELEDASLPPLPVPNYLTACLKTMQPEMFKNLHDPLSEEFRRSAQSMDVDSLLRTLHEQREEFKAALADSGLQESEFIELLAANPKTRRYVQAIERSSRPISGFFDEIESLIKLIHEDLGADGTQADTPDLMSALTPYPKAAQYAATAPAAPAGAPLHDAAAAARHRQLVINARANGYSCAQMDLSNANLAGLDLAGMDFSGAILAGANLAGAQLQGANLCDAFAPGAQFDAANLAGCRLSRASLSGASFTAAVLLGAQFDGCDCTGANFGNADLTGANLSGASFRNAWCQGLHADRLLASGAQFDQANLDHARLPAAQLERASFAGASAKGIDLQRAVCTGLNISQADLSASVLRGAQLNDSQAGPGTSLDGAVLDDSNIANASWMGITMKSASLIRVQAQGIDLSESDLSRARFRGADLRNARFDRSDLSNADLYGANLMQASFSHSEMQFTNFESSNLYGATFQDPRINGARFTGANLDRSLLATN